MERQPPSILIRIKPGTSGHDCRSRILSGGEVDIDLVTERSPQCPPIQPGTVKFGGKRSPSIDLSQPERRPNRTDCSNNRRLLEAYHVVKILPCIATGRR